MTNKPHTPTVDELRRMYALKVPHDQRDRRNAEFDRFIAAAEQRGAEPFINMIERVAEHPSLIGTQTAQDTKQLLDSIQANHTEGDE